MPLGRGQKGRRIFIVGPVIGYEGDAESSGSKRGGVLPVNVVVMCGA
jgi:hypothetical protein